ncbi:MAG: cupin domain-containing protein [Nannocystaceae bacterium]
MTESVDPIDAAFSDILRSLRLRSGLLSRARVHAPFAVGTAGVGLPIFHAIVAGACSIRREADATAHALEPGDVAIVTRGDAHVLFDAPGRVVLPFSDLSHARTRAQIQLCQLEGPGPRTDILCGHFSLAHAGGDALFAQLPPLVVVRGNASTVVAWLHDTLTRLDLELDRDTPGAGEVITRLVDLLVIDVMRRCLLEAQASAPAWAGPCATPRSVARSRRSTASPRERGRERAGVVGRDVALVVLRALHRGRGRTSGRLRRALAHERGRRSDEPSRALDGAAGGARGLRLRARVRQGVQARDGHAAGRVPAAAADRERVNAGYHCNQSVERYTVTEGGASNNIPTASWNAGSP